MKSNFNRGYDNNYYLKNIQTTFNPDHAAQNDAYVK